MQVTIFHDLFVQFDQLTNNFVTDVSANAITALAPIVVAAMTLSFVIYGVLIIHGKIEMPLEDFSYRSFRIAIIVAIGMSGGIYQTQWARMIQTLPNDVATSLIRHADPRSADELIDAAAEQGFHIAGEAFYKASIYSKQGLVFALVGFGFLIGTIIFTVIGGVFIILSKVSLCILAALGPFFIFALLYPTTARLFESWLSQILSYSLLIILISAVFGFLLHLFSNMINRVQIDSNLNLTSTLGTFLIIVIAAVIIILRMPNMAASLSHGLVLDDGGAIKSIGKVSQSAANAAGRSIVNKVKRDLGIEKGGS